MTPLRYWLGWALAGSVFLGGLYVVIRSAVRAAILDAHSVSRKDAE